MVTMLLDWVMLFDGWRKSPNQWMWRSTVEYQLRRWDRSIVTMVTKFTECTICPQIIFNDDGGVKGVATADVGVAKDGSPKVRDI